MKQEKARKVLSGIGVAWFSICPLPAQVTAVTEPIGYVDGSIVNSKDPKTIVSTAAGTSGDRLSFGSNLYGIRLHHSVLVTGSLGVFGEK
jgi:hypothetical protein